MAIDTTWREPSRVRQRPGMSLERRDRAFMSGQTSPSLALEQVDHRFVARRRVAVDPPDPMTDEQPRGVAKQQPSETGASMLGRNTHVVDRPLVKPVARAAVVGDREHETCRLLSH